MKLTFFFRKRKEHTGKVRTLREERANCRHLMREREKNKYDRGLSGKIRIPRRRMKNQGKLKLIDKTWDEGGTGRKQAMLTKTRVGVRNNLPLIKNFTGVESKNREGRSRDAHGEL